MLPADLLNAQLELYRSPIEEDVDLSRLSRDQISRLAERISGVGRQGSPTAYRSARRQLERWRKGGVKLTLRSRERLDDAAKHALNDGADMRVYVIWGSARSARKKRGGEWLPPQDWIFIGSRLMRQVIEQWREGETQEAADDLFEGFLAAYLVPNIEDFIDSAEVIELDLQP